MSGVFSSTKIEFAAKNNEGLNSLEAIKAQILAHDQNTARLAMLCAATPWTGQ